MVLWIGVDDTDSLQGMCTTFLATEIVRNLTLEYDLVGYPRLVRLNPNIPWKTRGNGAVCLRIGHGRGRPRIVGSFDGEPVLSYPRGFTPRSKNEIGDRVGTLVERWSHFEDPNTNPAYALLTVKPSPHLYWEAVRGIVPLRVALAAARGLGLVRRYKNGRGAIGALSAISWRPRDRTYEILAYRAASRWGTSRTLDPASVLQMDAAFPTTFNNVDRENSHVVIAPRSACPVLFGIRGDDPRDLRPAMETIRAEPVERWLIFETNQGTDDHVVRSPPRRAGRTVRFSGVVTAAPRSLAGGHVVFAVDAMDVTAYEPSKRFRGVVRGLVPGDRVEVVGAVRTKPSTVNLERLSVLALASTFRKVANPTCLRCAKRAKSMGARQGFRCVRCRARFPESAAVKIQVARSLLVRSYEPPVGSGRHLSMPLKRM